MQTVKDLRTLSLKKYVSIKSLISWLRKACKKGKIVLESIGIEGIKNKGPSKDSRIYELTETVAAKKRSTWISTRCHPSAEIRKGHRL